MLPESAALEAQVELYLYGTYENQSRYVQGAVER